jgi:hypothetical protein
MSISPDINDTEEQIKKKKPVPLMEYLSMIPMWGRIIWLGAVAYILVLMYKGDQDITQTLVLLAVSSIALLLLAASNKSDDNKLSSDECKDLLVLNLLRKQSRPLGAGKEFPEGVIDMSGGRVVERRVEDKILGYYIEFFLTPVSDNIKQTWYALVNNTTGYIERQWNEEIDEEKLKQVKYIRSSEIDMDRRRTRALK